MRKPTDTYFLLCIEGGGYPVALEARKVYRAIVDADAESHGLVRVVDESDEDYLFPKSLFVPIKVFRRRPRRFSLTRCEAPSVHDGAVRR